MVLKKPCFGSRQVAGDIYLSTCPCTLYLSISLLLFSTCPLLSLWSLRKLERKDEPIYLSYSLKIGWEIPNHAVRNLTKYWGSSDLENSIYFIFCNFHKIYQFVNTDDSNILTQYLTFSWRKLKNILLLFLNYICTFSWRILYFRKNVIKNF